jgi:hypothetical protein
MKFSANEPRALVVSIAQLIGQDELVRRHSPPPAASIASTRNILTAVLLAVVKSDIAPT